jgi:hypothetical protein
MDRYKLKFTIALVLINYCVIIMDIFCFALYCADSICLCHSASPARRSPSPRRSASPRRSPSPRGESPDMRSGGRSPTPLSVSPVDRPQSRSP